jgi:hypothetical protein
MSNDFRWWSCLRKQRFGSFPEAFGALVLLDNDGKIEPGEELYVYNCTFCHGFHYGHVTEVPESVRGESYEIYRTRHPRPKAAATPKRPRTRQFCKT